ncbi:phage portal protein [Escherichia coli]|uniref:phage portal protein n=43 Tax=Pseudomonadati TaxID=3379134 RepID=UPI0021CC4E45|nr:phage portal protein [Escherichia coli]CAI4148206.1 hypothetical protein ANGUJ1_23700 [Escherichia coli]
MAILDDVIGVFSPGWKAARLRSRAVIQAYEAVKTTRTHKARRENRTADQLSQYGAVSLREQARYLDNNHDLVIGVFDKLEERVVGKNGIIVEPHPVLRNGAIARDLAAEIRTRWSEWSVSPEVTGQFTRPMLERLMLRTWLRDGEVFAQMVSGRINSLTPSAGVHFWLEALEPDFIPMTSDESNRLNQGVFVDDWGRPEKYLVYKSRPVSGRQMETKEVDAERMLHLKFVRRLHQMRGTSLLSGVLIRLSALKEYEDSELTAARIAAALGMYIRKGDGQSYEADGNGSKDKERELTIQPGIIYDDLKPGEEIGMVKSDRPNPNLETFRNGQLRAVAAGSRLSFSSTARNYNGTYSAQRQELVESTDGYLILQDWFIGAVTRPMYRAWLKQAVASGVIRLPRDLDLSSLYTAVYSGPVMPWIDPVKEAEAWKIQIRGGAATESDWVRAGGRKGVSFLLRLTVTADDGSERLVSTARTTETTYRFRQLALGNYRLTVRAVNAWGQQGDPASVSFRIAAPAAPSRIELTPGYFQITATPHLAVYDPTVQFEFWFSEKRIADIRQVETSARYLGTALYWIAASINIKPGHDYYFYVRSVNTVGKSAFVEAVGQPSDDASGYLDFFKGEIGKTHLAQELWTQIDNGQLAPDLTEIRTSITDVSNEITQTVNKKLEDQSAAIQQIQKVQVDTNNNLNSMWAVKLQQMQDGRLYIAGIGAGIENTPDGMQSQVLLAADRIAMINPANGNTKPMFVGQGDQIFMNEVFLKRLTAPTITSGGSPPVFSLTSDGKLTAKNADISGSVNANSGTLNNVTINQNCTIKGMLEATQVRGDFVKAVSKAFPKKVGTWGNTETPNGTVTVTISDDHNFDRQIIIPPIIFNGIAYSDPGSGNNPGGTRYTGYGFEVRKNGVLIASRETKGAIPGSYSAVIDMPSGRGSVTLEFKIFQKGNQGAGNITDCTVIVTKKAASGISIR